jgi:hypothetical protein
MPVRADCKQKVTFFSLFQRQQHEVHQDLKTSDPIIASGAADEILIRHLQVSTVAET